MALRLDPEARGVGVIEQVYFATTREALEGQGFGPRRSSRISYGRLDVSVPPNRKLGQIPQASDTSTPDPRRDFVVADASVYAADTEFRHHLAQAIRATPEARGEVVVVIHGYNTTFAEAVYRSAQLKHDMSVPSINVLYSWPSAGKALRYAYDRDSVLFARSGLEDTLGEVVAAGASQIVIVAHSLGSELVMETLRQMKLDGNRRVMSRIHGVVLLSPDIDTQVFRRQAKEVGKLPRPFVIVVSGRDHALALSAALTGRSTRLGNLKELDKVSALDVMVLDVSAYSIGFGHFTPGNSPTLLAMWARFRDVIKPFTLQNQPATDVLPGIAQTLENATEIVLSPH